MPSAKLEKTCVSRMGMHQKCEMNVFKQKSRQTLHRHTDTPLQDRTL